jgi:hypothetical protein
MPCEIRIGTSGGALLVDRFAVRIAERVGHRTQAGVRDPHGL